MTFVRSSRVTKGTAREGFPIRLRPADSRWSYQATREHRTLVNETKFVAERVCAIKTAFAPGLRLDRPKDGAVGSSAHAPIEGIEIVYREVHMVRIRPRVPRVAVGPWIETSKDGAAAPEVMPSRRDPNSWLFQEGRVEDGGVIDTCHGKDYAE